MNLKQCESSTLAYNNTLVGRSRAAFLNLLRSHSSCDLAALFQIFSLVGKQADIKLAMENIKDPESSPGPEVAATKETNTGY